MNETLIAAQTFDLKPESGEGMSDSSDLVPPAATPAEQDAGRRLYDLLQVDGAGSGVAAASTSNASGLRIGGEGTKTLGDAILARLDAVGANYKQNLARAYSALEKSPRENTVEDLLKMQLDISVVSLEVEVVGKGVQKAVQHIDTLSKLQ